VDVNGNILPLPSSQDHKAIYDGDRGPNTGGMGAYSWAPVITTEMFGYILNHIVKPVVKTMREIGRPFVGFLYFGLKINSEGIWVLEINARMGDPEDKPILIRLKSPFLTLLEATVQGTLDQVRPVWDNRPALCVIMASGGYPGNYRKGLPIFGLEAAENLPNVMICHAGTAVKDGQVVTSGGRVLGVTALGDDFYHAQANAYLAAGLVEYEDKYNRTDIGYRAIARLDQKK
jgi:phosphoribosylamine--glycine ligase